MYISEEIFKKIQFLTQKLSYDYIIEDDFYLYTKKDPLYDFDIVEVSKEINEYLEQVE